MRREKFMPEFPEVPQDDREKELTINSESPQEIPQADKENQVQELKDRDVLPESPEAKTEGEEEKTEEPGATEKLLRGMNNKTVKKIVTAVVFAAAMGGAGKFAESGQKNSGDIKSSHKKIEQTSGVKEADRPLRISDEQTEYPGHIESLGADFTFFKKGPDGELKFNWWSLIAPLQAEVGLRDLVGKETECEVPYHYARLFSKDAQAGHPLHEQDHEKIVRYVEQQLKRQFVEVLHGLDDSKNIHNLHHRGESPDVHNLNIKNIEITGFASPEGPRSDGPDTVLPGNKDLKNLLLGKQRASHARYSLVSELNNSSIKGKARQEIGDALTANEIGADELQFVNEMRELAVLADQQGEKGIDDAEKIYNLIIDYNEGRIQDARIKNELDKIVASKRKVEIKVNYEGQQARKVLIPIPLIPILLLGAYGAFRRREQSRDGNGPADSIGSGSETGLMPSQPEIKPLIKLSSKKYNFKHGLVDKDKISEGLIDITKLPPRESIRYEKMEEDALIKDLYIHFDRSDTKDGGLDYRKIADEFENEYERYQNNPDREHAIADLLLDQWREYDIKNRRAAGVTEDQLGVGLDNHKNKHEVEQALMHARIILEMIEEKMKTKDDYSVILGRKTQTALRRRTFRDQ